MKQLRLLFFTTLIVFSSNVIHAETRTYNDSAMNKTIHQLFKENDLINPYNISTQTNKGHVKLKGVVNSYTEYEQAVILAHSVKGVKTVGAKNLHVTKSEQLLKDTLITAEIKGAAIRAKLVTYHDIRLQNINIETNNGHVYMSGIVLNQDQKDNLMDIAIQINGVKDVDATALKIRRIA